MQQICGNYCPPSAFTLRLAKFYLEVNRKREDKLEPIPLFDTRDSDSFLFVMEIGGAGHQVQYDYTNFIFECG